MEAVDLNENQILAFGRLMEYSANKRFAIKNTTFKRDEIGLLAETINKQIFQTKGVDIFQVSDIHRIEIYEDELTDRFANYTSEQILQRNVDDEVKLIEKAIKSDNKIFKSIDFSIRENARNITKPLKINDKSIVEWVKNADYVNYIPNDDPSKPNTEYLLTYKTKFNNTDRIVLIHADLQPLELYSGFVKLVLLFDYDEFEDLHGQPYRLFLKAIDYYAISLKLGGTTKRFFDNHIVHQSEFKIKNGNFDLFFLENTKYGEKIVAHSTYIIDSLFYIHYYFSYAISVREYLKDYFSKEI